MSKYSKSDLEDLTPEQMLALARQNSDIASNMIRGLGTCRAAAALVFGQQSVVTRYLDTQLTKVEARAVTSAATEAELLRQINGSGTHLH